MNFLFFLQIFAHSVIANILLINDKEITIPKLLNIYKYNYINTYTTKIIITKKDEEQSDSEMDNSDNSDDNLYSLIVNKFLSNMDLPYEMNYFRESILYGNIQVLKFFLWLPEKNVNLVIFSPNLTAIMNAILINLEKNEFNHRNKILIVYFIKIENSNTEHSRIRDEIQEFFHQIWKHNIINICVYYYAGEGGDKSESREFVYSFNPFKPSGDFLVDSSEIDIKDCYPEKAANMYGTPLRVSLFQFVPNTINKTFPFSKKQHWAGIDGGAMLPLAQYLNTTYTIVGPNDGKQFGFEKIINGTYALLMGGATADLTLKRADIAMNTRAIMPSAFTEAMLPYYSDNVVLVVAKSNPIPQYLSFLRAFDFRMRALIIFSIFAACVINKLFKHYYKAMDKSFGKAFLQTLIAFLGGGVFNMPRNQPSRMYYISWTIYCFFIINAFTSTIISIFVVPMYGKDIDNFADLINSPYSINVIEERLNATKVFKKDSNTTSITCCSDDFERLYKKFKGLKFDQFYGQLQNNNIKFAYIFVSSKAKFLVNLKRFSNAGRPVYHIIKYPVIPGYASFNVQRGSPFFYTVHRFLTLSIEAGLTKYWEVIGGYIQPELPEAQQHYHSLGIDKFESAFIIHAIGIAVATFCFFGEFIAFKWKQYQLMKSNPFEQD